MDIRFIAPAADGRSGPGRWADHARQQLQRRLAPCRDRVAHVSVRLGDTSPVRGTRTTRDMYCVMQVQLRDKPAASVVEVGTDTHATIDRCTDRIGRLVAELLNGAGETRPQAARAEAVTA